MSPVTNARRTLEEAAADWNRRPAQFADNAERALAAVTEERQRQDALFGDQSEISLFEWVSILGEECGELCEAINETCFKSPHHPERGGTESIIKEAAQVAAVALQIIEAAYRRKTEGGDRNA